jgi:hypothetical protein
MYAVIKSMSRTTFTMAHESGKVGIPILAYDDAHLDGEHFINRVKDNYMDVMSLDAFRAEFMGRQWGPMPFFLPELRDDYSSQIEPTRGMLALLMIHDVSPWAVSCKLKVMNDAWTALDEFGYAKASFLPYFDSQPPATFDPQPLSITGLNDVHRVNISAYQQDDKRTLLIVANLDKDRRVGKLRINFQRGLRIPLQPLPTVMDWLTKRPLELQGDSLPNFDIPGLDYRMLVVQAG